MREPCSRPGRLLIAWDGMPRSSASIPCALGLAAPDAHLVLLHIAPVAKTRRPLSRPSTRSLRATRALARGQRVTPGFSAVDEEFIAERDRVAAMLDQAASTLRTAGVQVTVGIEHGASAESIHAATTGSGLLDHEQGTRSVTTTRTCSLASCGRHPCGT